MAMEIMGIIGITGMLMSVANSGKDSLVSSGQLRQSIAQMQAKIDSFKAGYTQLLVEESKDIQELKDKINEDVQAITMYSKRIEGEKDTHSTIYRSIQMAGIILISAVAFIFILKLFGFYDIIQNVIEIPFKNLFRKK